jgi:2-methylcitrate dehydratase PrpD
MGIAYAQCATNLQALLEGALTVRLQQGFGGQTGVLSIVLADEGFTGAKDMLEGKYGYYPVYMPDECLAGEREILTAGLGKRFEDSDVSIKPYPCCRANHSPIDGTLQLVKEHNIKANNIQQVTIYTRQQSYEVCGGERKVAPQSVPDAQFSFYYTVATALVKGRVFIEHFTEEAIRDPEVLEMARKVKVIVDPEKEKYPETNCPIDIEIETKDGKHFKKTVEFPKGHAKNPMTMAEVSQKLRDCAEFSVKPLSSKKIDKIIQMTESLDKLDDVTVILECLK